MPHSGFVPLTKSQVEVQQKKLSSSVSALKIRLAGTDSKHLEARSDQVPKR